MTNFQINFSNPWLLFLLIPAIAFTLIPYFRLSKKYRKTRNRITSIVLHTVIMVLCVCVLSGMTFSYEVPNPENEILLVVDMSFSNEKSQDDKDEFVKSILDASNADYQIGVVTFGFDQVYAAEMSRDTNKVYREYQSAVHPDDSATDIASALNFARDIFKKPESAKIVLITDGIETEDDAKTLNVVKSLAADGIQVDTVHFPKDSVENEVQIIDVKVPDYNIKVGDTFDIEVTVQSSYSGAASIDLYDTVQQDETKKSTSVEFLKGVQTITLQHALEKPDLHKLCVNISNDKDSLSQNNSYHTYIYLDIFDQILVIEKYDGESAQLKELLEDGKYKKEDYNVTVVNIDDATKVPDSLDKLRQYDQVILVNIANADMPDGFIEILNSYVYEVGGGLFTVGGNKLDSNGNTLEDINGNPVANAYNREDMAGTSDDPSSTIFKQMLPVQAVDYTPPLGLMIIIDRSGSMSTSDKETGKTVLDLAKEGAISCLNALTERDWCGVMTLESTYDTNIKISRATQKSKIIEAIDEIEIGGGTVFNGAISAAGRALSTLGDVDKKHIILVTDGQPGDNLEQYGAAITHNYETFGITMSIVVVGAGGSSGQEDIRTAAEEMGHGKYYGIRAGKFTEIINYMREDLNIPEIKEVVYEPFVPTIKWHTSIVNGIAQEDMPRLNGFYGTKKKDDATDTLVGPYGIPIYAQWKYGEGMVGSFMCDLNGTWSQEFLTSVTGNTILYNIISGLFPTQNIRKKDIEVDLTERNYTTQISVYTQIDEGERIEVTIESPSSTDGGDYVYQTIKPTEEEGYSRISFTVTQPGIHKVIIQKLDAEGTVLSETVTYKSFSYSKEYDMFVDTDGLEFVTKIAENGKGKLIDESPADAFEGLLKTLPRMYDPRLVFIIISIVLFLLDVAVRKFKFKWPHELIRDFKTKKDMK